MKRLLILLSFICMADISAAQSNMSDFVGTWFLQSIEAKSASGKWVPFEQLGSDPVGILTYDKAGNMAVQIVRQDRSIPDPENAVPAIVNGYDAYFGTYEIDDEAKTITHHRVAHINADLDDLSVIRYFQLEGDILTLLVAPDRKFRIKWKRQE